MIVKLTSEKVDYLELFVDDILVLISSENPITASALNGFINHRDTVNNALNCRIGRQYRVNY